MTRPELQPYNGREFQIVVPEHWEQVEGPGPPVSLIALEPRNGDVFRANIVVTVEDIDDAVQWQQTAGRALADHMQDYLLLDERREDSCTRRLFHHVLPDSGAITAEQWSWPVGRRGFTLTASSATFDYEAKADLFALVVRGFRTQGTQP